MTGKLLSEKNPTNAVKNELNKVEELKRICADDDGELDPQLILDMIEGETNLNEMIFELDDILLDHETKAEAMKIRIGHNQKRMARHVQSGKSIRNVMLAAMDKAGIQKLDGLESTISLKSTPETVSITDEALLPPGYFKTVETISVDKKQLKEDLKGNKEVPGASLNPKGITIMIRRS